MSDPIDRQAAIDAIRKDMYADKDFMSAIICDGIENVLRSLPSAQAERKTGRLKYESAYNWFRCNVCRKIYPSEFLQYFDSCQYQPRFNFCPNCGARMEGER